MRGKIIVAAILVACEAAPEPVPTWAGEHVKIYAEIETHALCAGSIPHIDRYIDRVLDALGEPDPENFSVSVRIVDDLPCAPEFAACYQPEDQAVYMDSFENHADDPLGVLRHEITHAVVDRAWGRGIPFFNEGLAETMSRSDEPTGASDAIEPIGDMLAKKASELDYRAAARFTRFLIDKHGIAKFKRMYQETQRRSQEEIEARFMEIYGQSFEDLEAEYLSGPPRCQYQLDTCDPAEAVPVSTMWSTSFVVSCEDPSFHGTVGTESVHGESSMATAFTLDIEHAGNYLLTSGPVTLVRCGPCAEQFATRVSGTDVELALDAGYYSIEIQSGAESSGVRSLHLVAVADSP